MIELSIVTLNKTCVILCPNSSFSSRYVRSVLKAQVHANRLCYCYVYITLRTDRFSQLLFTRRVFVTLTWITSLKYRTFVSLRRRITIIKIFSVLSKDWQISMEMEFRNSFTTRALKHLGKYNARSKGLRLHPSSRWMDLILVSGRNFLRCSLLELRPWSLFFPTRYFINHYP